MIFFFQKSFPSLLFFPFKRLFFFFRSFFPLLQYFIIVLRFFHHGKKYLFCFRIFSHNRIQNSQKCIQCIHFIFPALFLQMFLFRNKQPNHAISVVCAGRNNGIGLILFFWKIFCPSFKHDFCGIFNTDFRQWLKTFQKF